MDRRRFLHATGATAGAVFATDLWSVARAQEISTGAGPYGRLGPPDQNGVRLPEGFTTRVIARAGDTVGDTGYQWPIFPDGAAAFEADDGGWYLAVNSEDIRSGEGGVSALQFDQEGEVVDAYPLVTGTRANCAGGPTPWATWLSCEEFDVEDGDRMAGQVWECDPTEANSGAVKPAMGSFNHEAVAVDPEGEALYLTEDNPEGGFYRFTPDSYPSLDDGLLEVAEVADDGTTTWSEIPDPSAVDGPVREQVASATPFNGGEGCWYDRGVVYFATKGDDRIWAHDIEAETITVLYDAAQAEDAPLRGVDNVIVEAGSGDILVAEDGDDMQVVLITDDRVVAPLLQITDEPLPAKSAPSEVTGLAFSPDGTRLYFASQRGGDPQSGISYEVTGPFRGAGQNAEDTSTPTTVLEGAAERNDDGGDDGGSPAVPIGIGVAVVAAGGAAAVALRNRRS